MSLSPGTRLGSYEIIAPLGAGGMGEVYRAYDSKLRREVAVKVLPASLRSDTDGLARFEREAHLLAALNHPNIGAIYGVEDSDPSTTGPRVQALVLELVEGETLAQHLQRSKTGALGLTEALGIARQIAEALDAAHEKGIVHRDLKPANVKITPAGVVKVLDFGLGKYVVHDTKGSGADLVSQLDTARAADTVDGVILGTPAYMSPEQARGRPVDKRSDVWAFGCVLYEMITGRRAFAGEDIADTLSRVLQREPDLAALSETTPPAVRRLLARCLEKDPNKRLSQIAVAAYQIDEALAASASGAVAAPLTPHLARTVRWIGAALVAGALVGAAGLWLIVPHPTVAVTPVTRLHVSVSPADEIGGFGGRPTRTAFVLSPDGRTLVFSAVVKNQRALYARPLDQPAATAIPGTENAVNPFMSPDGQWIGYWASGQIRKVPLKGGGPSVQIVATPQTAGATWTDDDRIIFARGAGGLLEIPSAGGSTRELTVLSSERAEVGHRLPHVLPGGDAVLFTVTKNRFPRWDEAEVWVHSRGSGQSKRLIESGADARFVSSGHLLYVREGALLVVPFDSKRLEVTGGPVGVVPDVMQAAYVAGQPNDSGAMQASVSRSGTLVYVTGGVQPPTEYDVLSVDRTGQAEPLPIPPQDFRLLRLSPDGGRLALSTVGRERGTWLYAFDRGTLSRLAGAGRSTTPVWTPDGERITYSASSNGPNNVHWIRADGSDKPELLITSARNIETAGWTPNGRDLLYYEIPDVAAAGAGGTTLWAQDVASKGARRQLAESLGNAAGADVSPDGRWVAYHSAESGVMQVYVDAYPGPGPRIQISTDGGGSPIWRADGRELFYARSNTPPPRAGAGLGAAAADVEIMAVEVTPKPPTLSFGKPQRLFTGRYSMNGPARGYDVSRDGRRFLLLRPRERAPEVISAMHVVQNWIAELR